METKEVQLIKVGDLAWWLQSDCEVPGLVLDVKPAREVLVTDCAFTSYGNLALFMQSGLDEPIWMHEVELEKIEQTNDNYHNLVLH